MQLKNKIINYFVSLPLYGDVIPRVFRSLVTMDAKTARALISKQLSKEKNEDIQIVKLLHVCYDYDSEMIYVPNAVNFTSDQLEPLLQAAKVRITKDFGGFSSKPPIQGSPFSSIRVRSINSFPYTKKVIENHYEGKVFQDLPVVEVNLDRMPTTIKSLPKEFTEHKEFLGGYIGTSFASSVSFIEEYDIYGKKLSDKKLLLEQKTPFILINNVKKEEINGREVKREPGATEKEWAVLSAYRDYLEEDAVKEEKYIVSDINQFADLYAIKRYLYLGWSFEEVASLFCNTRQVTNLPELIKAIQRLMFAVDSLVKEGYDSPARDPYYITFKVDDSFPIDMQSITNITEGKAWIDKSIQFPYFSIIDYDTQSSYVLIQSMVFVSPDICSKILKAKSAPFIAKYNPVFKKIDVKGEDKSYKELSSNKIQLYKIQALVGHDIKSQGKEEKEGIEFRTGPEARGEWAVNPEIYNVRKISEYYYATDFIKKMCEKNNIPFQDFDVIIGPIEKKFGRGTQGGFMDKNMFIKSKMAIPYEIEKGIWVSPPVMFINSVTMPSYAEQTETLIHEYRHYLFGLQEPTYEPTYNKIKDKGNEFWYEYFTDPSERAAHKEEIMYELMLGKSYDEIIRNKVGGQVLVSNYPIARKFSELVQEAMDEIEKKEKQNEEPIGEN